VGLRQRLKGLVRAAIGGRPVPAPTPGFTGAVSQLAGAPAKERASGGFVEVAKSPDVGEGRSITRAHAGHAVAIFRHGGALYAVDNACAHEDGPIGEGTIAGSRVRCPYHDWEYEFTTGACITDPSRRLARFAVEERDGAVWLGPTLQESTGARGGDHNDGMEVIKQ
jgi:nitrite reductase/ring-hydroxylating ferredoxin subunit